MQKEGNKATYSDDPDYNALESILVLGEMQK